MASSLLCLLAALAAPAPSDAAYTTASWPVPGLGNHRAVLALDEPLEKTAPAVHAHIAWRRRDAHPEAIETIVVDAATGKRVRDVIPLRVNRECGDFLFRPPASPGTYHVYYLPFKTEGWWAFPVTKYLPPEKSASPDWVEACAPLVAAFSRGDRLDVPSARLVELQSINDFHRFDPMEITATPQEVKKLLARHGGAPYLLFGEDRRRPIRMTDDLPLCWIRRGPALSFRGKASRGEFYAFQVGVYAPFRAVEDLTVTPGALQSADGQTIPAAAIRCFNAGGIDWLGRPFRKTLDVKRGKVQALWFGVEVPRDARAGEYSGVLTFRARGLHPVDFQLRLGVGSSVLEDAGDSDIARHSRLRWLDSTIGLDDEVFAPYEPVRVAGRTVHVLGRDVRFSEAGLPESIRSTFGPNVDRTGAPGREILAREMTFQAVSGGAPLVWKSAGARVTKRSPGAVWWQAAARDATGSVELSLHAKMECDGYTNYHVALRFLKDLHLDDVRLEIPVRRQVARYLMGMGRKGGLRPAAWDWKWDVSRANSHLWIGDVNAGIQLKLKHVEDRWDLYNLKASGIYRDWGNGGKGGCTVREDGDAVLVRAFTGPRSAAAGSTLHFNFGLLVTPVKILDPGHWKWRYFHKSKAVPVPEVAGTGATVINIHQGGPLNPYINYPFLTVDKLSAYTSAAHARGLKVKIYYTVRELSNHTVEFWALRSLGNEVFLDGPGFQLADQFLEKKEARPAADALSAKGDSWLCEHAVSGYVPAWHQPLGNGRCDAAIATAGLSRWHNYYLEGLAWLVRNAGIDGLYLDGIGYDREIMKRVRKVLQRSREGCLIDFHSGNNFHPQYGLNNCAGEYMELFPCIDSLWFGEGFDYNETPDYWLVEISGIPFGLFGEMLQGGGNPWRGMVYGMTSRLGWGGDPRGIWKIWDDFGIEKARMAGYWDASSPVKTGRDDVLATAYIRTGETRGALIALASWAKEPVLLRLELDLAALGLDAAKVHLYAPPVRGLQEEALFAPGDEILVPPARGWLLLLDERARKVQPAVDPRAGRKVLLDDDFSKTKLDPGWTVHKSARPGTRVAAAGGKLAVQAAANSAAFIERPLPPHVRLVWIEVDPQTDQGATWGPGVALLWPGGKTLRLNVRAEGRFGVDGAGRQILGGLLWPKRHHRLALCIGREEILAAASSDGKHWQTIARVPARDFPGEPKAIRVGKMSGAARNEDFPTAGPAGTCAILRVEALGDAKSPTRADAHF